MLSFKILDISIFFMAFSIGYLIAELLQKKLGNNNDKKFLKIARIILICLNTVLFIWLLFNKELFHWNYDIATGEPVDHYSTYGRCIINTVVALISNIVACVFNIKNKQ